MIDKRVVWWRWLLFAIVSVIFFHIVGSTYTSLGVVLPYMIEDLSWSWTQAGLGFTLLALLTGLASTVPAWTLRRLGTRATYGIGCAIMASGFTLLALTDSHQQYFFGAGLLGLGFPLCASVPAVHLINNWFPDRRSFVIGAYMTIGGLGGVAGPLVVTGIVGATGSWRAHWWTMALVSLLLLLIAIILVKSAPDMDIFSDREDKAHGEKRADRVYQSKTNWSLRETLYTPQYYVIVAAMTITLFCEVTTNSWAVAHMGMMGVSASIAAGALSAHAAINSVSRIFGGILATRIDPKWLLVSALVAEVIGMLALSVADDPLTITLFAIGEGYGFGMCLFTTTVLLVNYFGPENNPEILGTLNLITTIAMLGPVMGGFIGDKLGGVSTLFQGYSVILLIIVVLTVLMRPPVKDASIEVQT